MNSSTKILVVDDDSSILHALTARLTHMGHDVTARKDVMSAVGDLVDISPDVAIIDINLPGADGFELARKLDEQILKDGMPTVKKIFLTASKDPALRTKATAVGAVGFLEKPYTPADLISILDHCTGPDMDDQISDHLNQGGQASV